MIELKFMGSADEVKAEMAAMLGLRRMQHPQITPTVEIMNADTAAALDKAQKEMMFSVPSKAPESTQDAIENKDEETIEEDVEMTPVLEAVDVGKGVTTEILGVQEEAEVITLVQARERMNSIRQKYGAKTVRQVLDTIGFPKFTDVPDEKYPELMALCDAIETGMTAAKASAEVAPNA